MVMEEHLSDLLPLLDPTLAYPTSISNGTTEYQQSSDMQRILLQIVYLLSDSGILIIIYFSFCDSHLFLQNGTEFGFPEKE